MLRLVNKIKQCEELKKKLDDLRPLPQSTIKQLKQFYRISLAYTSNALEGNTLTETETKVILEDGLTIGGKSFREHAEALGHSDAFDVMYKIASRKKFVVTEKDILELHRNFYSYIDKNEAGQYRKIKVMISGSHAVFPKPSDVKKLMQQFVRKLANLQKKAHPIEVAAYAHAGLVNIHPFVDGNGRTARLLMNLFLLRYGYTIAVIPPILRSDYLTVVQQAHSEDKVPFEKFISMMVCESLKDLLRMLK